MELLGSIASWQRVTVPNAYVFGKYDGTQVRIEVDGAGKLRKVGLRDRLLDDAVFNLKREEVVALYEQDYLRGIRTMAKRERWDRATLFLEFYGPNSFAGWHAAEAHELMLFDLHDGRELWAPNRFVKETSRHGITVARLLHQGNFNAEVAAQVSEGTLPGMPLEGVVVKSHEARCKWKSIAWLRRLKDRCGTGPEGDRLYQSLA